MRALNARSLPGAPGLERTLQAAAVLSVMLMAVACDSTVSERPDEAPNAVLLGFHAQTTNGATAASNLDAAIDGLRVHTTRLPSEGAPRTQLVNALLTRASFHGATDDLDEALRVAEDAPALRARVLTALHRFDDALDLASGAAHRALSETVDLAREHELEWLHQERQRVAETLNTFTAWVQVAAVARARGLYRQADDAYLQALAVYTDVSPYAVADVQFQRGVMWSERAGRPDLALPLYRDAVARLPTFVVAGVHLAELEPRRDAIARLEVLVDAGVGDPEPYGKLAELVIDDAPDRARELTHIATATYDRLLAAHPLAYADHGAEFFMGPGADPARALRLAELNLANRATERAHALTIRAALAVGDLDRACALADAVRAPVGTGLSEALDALDGQCVAIGGGA